MTHIVCAIGCEAARARDDWETALLCAEAERADETPSRPANAHLQDNYCFEMLSLVSTVYYSIMSILDQVLLEGEFIKF